MSREKPEMMRIPDYKPESMAVTLDCGTALTLRRMMQATGHSAALLINDALVASTHEWKARGRWTGSMYGDPEYYQACHERMMKELAEEK